MRMSVKFQKFIIFISKLLFKSYDKYKNTKPVKIYRNLLNTDNIINVLIEHVGWDKIQKNLYLYPEFIEKHYQHLNKNILIQRQKLQIELLEKYYNDFDKGLMCKFQKLTPVFIEKHYNTLHWRYLLIFQHVPEHVIELYYNNYCNDIIYLTRLQFKKKEHSEIINWETLSCFQKLSDAFIQKYINKISWKYISKNQKLINYIFIKKYLHKLHYTKQIYNIIKREQALIIISKLYDNIPNDIIPNIIQYV